MISQAILAAVALAGAVRAQVTATGTMGPTNPPAATMGTANNQSSDARLLSLNAIDDFCLFGPGTPNQAIGDSEAVEVAWCVQNRNNARVIPDGTFTAVHFVKTPLYWQIQGFGDFTKINIQANDEGGELDPHGATGLGNPVGGNVTTNATGEDVSYQEWMNYMSANQFCLRICIAANSTYTAALMCQHTLDEMGCEWVMPGDYTETGFTECDGDSAYPPGLYPETNGSTSTFAQRYTGTYTIGSTSTGTFTVGETVTPQTPYSIPATSNCITYSTIGSGAIAIATASNITNPTSSTSNSSSSSTSSSSSSSISSTSSSSSASASNVGAVAAPGATTTTSQSGSSAGSSSDSSASGSSASASTSSKAGALTTYSGVNYGPAIAAAFSVVALLAGAGAILL